MRQTHLFTKTAKTVPPEETSANAQLLLRAGYVDKLMAGVYTILPLGQMVLTKIEQIIREGMVAVGGQEIIMPALHPKQLWQTTGRVETMNEILYTTNDASGHEYILGPSHEEVVTPLLAKYVTSYRDLPVAVFQFQVKFRKELRPKAGLLRGREFIMKDMYSAHASSDDLEAYYLKVQTAYRKIFERVGLGDTTYRTLASGGAFSRYSHEFQTITVNGEDTIFLCEQCQLGINREIKSETISCPECQGENFTEHRAIEVGNIFKLQHRFSDSFGWQFTDATGVLKPIAMGCYGIGLTRLLGTIVEVHRDERGIIWPKAVSPFDAHLINLNKNSVQADQVYDTLQKAGFNVLYDDRVVSAGVKFGDADLIGISQRLVVSAKNGNKIEVKPRAAESGQLLSIEEYISAHAVNA